MSLYQQICSESFFFLSIAMLSLMTVSVPFSFLKFYFLKQKCGFFLWFPCTKEFSRTTFYQKIFSEFFFVTIARLNLMTVYYFIAVFFKFNSCITEMWFLSQISMQQYWRSSFIRLLVDQQRQPNVYFSISILKYPWPLVSIKNW